MATVLENHPQGTERVESVVEMKEPQVTFNEQTNYVPRRTIITVSAENPTSGAASHPIRSFWRAQVSTFWP